MEADSITPGDWYFVNAHDVGVITSNPSGNIRLRCLDVSPLRPKRLRTRKSHCVPTRHGLFEQGGDTTRVLMTSSNKPSALHTEMYVVDLDSVLYQTISPAEQDREDYQRHRRAQQLQYDISQLNVDEHQVDVAAIRKWADQNRYVISIADKTLLIATEDAQVEQASDDDIEAALREGVTGVNLSIKDLAHIVAPGHGQQIAKPNLVDIDAVVAHAQQCGVGAASMMLGTSDATRSRSV